MAIEVSEVKRTLQDHLQEGLLLVVGSGLSMAEGIPGMGALAEHLKNIIPDRLASQPDIGWNNIVAALNGGDNLECAMGKVTLQPSTVDTIVEETASFILAAEKKVFERVLNGNRVLPFTRFAEHLFKGCKKYHLITPNYDRLIELAVEAAGIGIDSRFVGYLHGQPDAKRSADAHRETYYIGKTMSFRSLPCLCIHKAHGSLDWFYVNGKVIRCPINVGRVPAIITPGASKYRESFRVAYDDQRTSGNRAVASATKLMFIGYGFNDDHLEQYFCPGLKLTKPSVIMAKELTENALKTIQNSKGTNVIGLCAVSETDFRTRIVTSDGDDIIDDGQLWNLEGFNKGVL